MASTRRSPPADGAAPAARAARRQSPARCARVLRRRARRRRSCARCRTRAVAVALSGGRDSMALLDALASLARELRDRRASHVHHGLSPHADAWARVLRATLCAARDVPLVVQRVDVDAAPRESLEATARHARYAALAGLAREPDAAVALAHHADDQAETLLLQLLRGAGPHGLAAMPAARADARGSALLRPLLALPRADDRRATLAQRGAALGRRRIERRRSRTSATRSATRSRRARRGIAPGYPATLARAAAHQADAAALARRSRASSTRATSLRPAARRSSATR